MFITINRTENGAGYWLEEENQFGSFSVMEGQKISHRFACFIPGMEPWISSFGMVPLDVAVGAVVADY
jgi:hypothetical protein